jgi:succinate-semialdehyde dehydrogenase/glutarate-semialdehyde dehydrogenase
MATFSTVDPTHGTVRETFAYHEALEVDRRLTTAARAAAAWRAVPIAERAALLRAVAGRLRVEVDHLAAVAVGEMGKPIVQARAEVIKCAWCCDYFADNAEAMLDHVAAPSAATRSYVAFRPLGVVLAIMPWNYPYWQLFRAAAPALAAGNGIALKHAENSTRCALEIERIFTAAGAPPGLLTTILLSNDDTDILIADERIAAVTLTGSERAGVAVAGAAARVLKKCVLELGGSDAFIVLRDADIELAVARGVDARFQNNGQSCIAAKRFIVDSTVHDEFVARFTVAVSERVVGDPMLDATHIGPMARTDLRDAIHTQVRSTLDAGAGLVIGGAPLDRAGFFYDPTIVTGVLPGMPMFETEVFGPAAAIVRARDDDDALRLANASSFGLGGSIWTRDIDRAEALAGKLEAGNAFINGIVASDPRLPFGGIKKSGYGRELSAFGIHEFVNIQTVWIGPATT